MTRDVFALTPLSREFYRAIEPTKIRPGYPIVSGCCEEPLLSGPKENRKWVAVRTWEAGK